MVTEDGYCPVGPVVGQYLGRGEVIGCKDKSSTHSMAFWWSVSYIRTYAIHNHTS